MCSGSWKAGRLLTRYGPTSNVVSGSTTCASTSNASPASRPSRPSGPTRRRTPGLYYYRLIYRDALPDQPGCAAVWEVRGGRLRYQIALERDGAGRFHWHCTCADAVYRAVWGRQSTAVVTGDASLLAGLAAP